MRAPIRAAVCILFLVILSQNVFCLVPPPSHFKSRNHLSKFRSIIAAKSKARSILEAPLKKQDGRVFYPIGYGADPGGVQDSSAAILGALVDAFRLPNEVLELQPGVKDLGGVVIDLQGGNYLVDQPIRFPVSGVGNVVVQGGTLRASSKFPADRHLIELWSTNSPDKVGFYYDDITFQDILFDSSFQGGGLYVIDSARIRVDNCFFVHFSIQGILVERGHDTLISNSFLGQHVTVGSDPGEKNFSGTGIELAGNDNVVSNVVIFSAATGVTLRGQANLLTGVHCYNKATYWGGIGILVQLPGNSQTRIDNCYLDYNAIVLEDPAQVLVSNAFFLGDGNIVLKSIKGKISGLTIVDNVFTGNPKNNVPIVKFDGEFTNIDQVVVNRNTVAGMGLKSTVGRMTVAGNGTKWTADFSQTLLFPNNIHHVQYSLYVRGQSGIPAHAVTNITGNVVTVESDKSVDGVVSVEVDQYNMVGESTPYM
ncbi:hypothetical protein ACHQM5_001891 [Ranunculus cassubicifolius]